MDFYPALEKIETICQGYHYVPVMTEIMADMTTPVNLFRNLKGLEEICFLLESAEQGIQFGRYSFIGVNPEILISVKKQTMTVTENGQKQECTITDPFLEIQKILAARTCPVIEEMPKFTGGLVGYFGYDTIRYIEPTVNKAPGNGLDVPEIQLMGVKDVIVFDHLKHKLMLITNMAVAGNLAENYQNATQHLKQYQQKILKAAAEEKEAVSKKPIVRCLLEEEKYMANVEKAKDYIQKGDIFQVVLSERFEIENPPDPFNVYRMLRASNPSPYMYYFQLPDCTITGASPEMLTSVENQKVYNHPIAGTVGRGKTPEEDKILENQLLADPKENAEHVMLVDLGRNDLGKVCQFGTVTVEQFMEVEKYSTLMHLVSRITGTLMPGKNGLDALKAMLPAGTLSGAPKVRAMQIIDELETVDRGVYGGTIGYIGYNGVMDTCITIRTAVFNGEKAYVQAGAGIVADSVAKTEYQEVYKKASSVLQAIEKAAEL